MDDLTAFQRDLLYVIAGLTDPHGREIRNELQEYYESDIIHGRVYPALEILLEEQLIERGEQDGRTNYYTLSERGAHEIQTRRGWEQQYLDDELSEELSSDE